MSIEMLKHKRNILDNTVKLLRKGKFELTGEEALAVRECFNLLIELIKETDAAIKPPAPVTMTPPITEAPKEEELKIISKKRKKPEVEAQ